MVRRLVLALLVGLALLPGPVALAAPDPATGRVRPAANTGFGFPLPAPVVVLSRFDPPDRPWGSGHRGVDLAGRGVVSVQHANGIRTTYEPVDPEVGRGEQVQAGQILGRLAAGHASCAPAVCLHWGARTGPDAYYLDPMLLVTGWPVRLLPWDGAPG